LRIPIRDSEVGRLKYYVVLKKEGGVVEYLIPDAAGQGPHELSQDEVKTFEVFFDWLRDGEDIVARLSAVCMLKELSDVIGLKE